MMLLPKPLLALLLPLRASKPRGWQSCLISCGKTIKSGGEMMDKVVLGRMGRRWLYRVRCPYLAQSRGRSW